MNVQRECVFPLGRREPSHLGIGVFELLGSVIHENVKLVGEVREVRLDSVDTVGFVT